MAETARRTRDGTVCLEHQTSMSNQAYGAGVRGKYVHGHDFNDDDE